MPCADDLNSGLHIFPENGLTLPCFIATMASVIQLLQNREGTG
jgi:hypothetical protein